MFEGLDDINWNGLRDAYGAAGKTPERIRSLVSDDLIAAKKALDELFFTIIHQGAIYPAAEAAAPFLGETLEIASPEILPGVLSLLAAMSRGRGFFDSAQHLPILGGPIRESLADPDAEIEEERDLVRDTARAVFAEWDRVTLLLDHPEATVRAAALYLLVTLGRNDLGSTSGPDDPEPYLGVRPRGSSRGSWAALALAAVEAALERNADVAEYAGALSAFLPLGRADHPALALDRTDDAPAIVRYVALEAAVARAGGFGAPLSDHLAGPIGRLIAERDQIDDILRSPIWRWGGDARRMTLDMATGLSDAAIDRIADELAPVLQPGEWQLYCMSTILRLALGARTPRIPDDPCQLSTGRRRLVLAITEKPKATERPLDWLFHPDNWTAQGRLKQLGLSGDATVWRVWMNAA